MSASSPSLLSFLETPVVVGDPDGRAVFVNPSFETSFRVQRGQVLGRPLALLFEGGGREAVLEAVARACEQKRSVRFRVREGGQAYTALASPICAEGASVGVILLLLADVMEEERLLAFCREIGKAVDEVGQCLDDLFDQTGGRRAERFRERVEEGVRTLERLRKWTEELRMAAAGAPPARSEHHRFDPVRVVRDAIAGLRGEVSRAEHDLELLVPARLPEVRGDGSRFGAALTSLLRDRLQGSRASSFTVAAKEVGQAPRAAVLVSLIETPAADAGDLGDAEPPPLVREIVTSLGGTVSTTQDPVLGRTTAIRLPLA